MRTRFKQVLPRSLRKCLHTLVKQSIFLQFLFNVRYFFVVLLDTQDTLLENLGTQTAKLFSFYRKLTVKLVGGKIFVHDATQ